MSTKTEPGPFDGMARAEPDEPVFTLRAHDPLAPGLVHEWVRLRREEIGRAHAAGEINDAKRELELIQCREAEEIAWRMKDWRTGMAPIVVEEKAEKPAAYSGHSSSEEELAAKARYDAIKAAGSLLNNAIAGITDAATEHLAPHGFPTERAVILIVADRLKAVSSHIAPKRASYYAGEPEPEPFVEGPLLDDPTTFSGLFLALHLIMREPIGDANRLHFAARCAEAANAITPGIAGGAHEA